MYTVRRAAALTGIPEATLRVWERRYGIVQPQRSEGGYRLYDDAQLATLREMAALVAAGVPASRAAATLRTASSPAAPVDVLDDDLVSAAASLDPSLLAAVIASALAMGTFEQAADGWLIPQIDELGEAWADGRLTIAQEHVATAALMRAIAGVYEEAGTATRGAPVLVGLPAGERHELALFSFATCLRRQGVDVVYLAADVPADEWRTAAATRHPRAAVIGVHTEGAAVEAQAVVDRLSTVRPPLSVWTGGSFRHLVTGAHPLPDSVSAAAAHLARHLAAGAA